MASREIIRAMKHAAIRDADLEKEIAEDWKFVDAQEADQINGPKRQNTRCRGLVKSS
jgi:hypothetical protein